MKIENSKYSMLIDTTRCVGCEECVAACQQVNETGSEIAGHWSGGSSDLSATRYTTIVKKSHAYVRRSCRHCLDAACVSACIVGALQQSPDGPVTYDKDKCMGCRYCMMACPFGIPRYEWESATPTIRKCIFCYEKIASGELAAPACVTECPENVTAFGTREEMLALAKARIQDNPGKYFKDHIYGEDEVGGTAVLLISDIDLSFLGWQPELSKEPLPDLTWAALSKVPPVVIGVGAFATAAYWVIGRRMKMAHEAAQLIAEGENPNEELTEKE